MSNRVVGNKRVAGIRGGEGELRCELCEKIAGRRREKVQRVKVGEGVEKRL